MAKEFNEYIYIKLERKFITFSFNITILITNLTQKKLYTSEHSNKDIYNQPKQNIIIH